ncbi:Uncharacterised protein [Legionella pneumophila]|nr:Uncharacterised protein [Legionella pneumophila]CZI94902.1 Uncharacterised protein [Legionella pneumophila]CZJ29675.1 Uncharacterised protein [Legionella pneumophila]SNW00341.1 Uncharacterised protein [Legionella pneumophila]SQG86462.1 Uncharacterised protein [Legionella pneumophila]
MLYIRYGTAGDGDDREDMIEGGLIAGPFTPLGYL